MSNEERAAKLAALNEDLAYWNEKQKIAEDEMKFCDDNIKIANEYMDSASKNNFKFYENSNINIKTKVKNTVSSYKTMYSNCRTNNIENAGDILSKVSRNINDLIISIKNKIDDFCKKIIEREEKLKEKATNDRDVAVRKINEINNEIASLN